MNAQQATTIPAFEAPHEVSEESSSFLDAIREIEERTQREIQELQNQKEDARIQEIMKRAALPPV